MALNEVVVEVVVYWTSWVLLQTWEFLILAVSSPCDHYPSYEVLHLTWVAY